MKRRVMFLTVVAMLSEEKEMRLEEMAHCAEERVLLLSCAWQAVTAESANAEGKLTEMSKLVLNVVIALRIIWYCALDALAVFGVTEEDATVRLTCGVIMVISVNRASKKIGAGNGFGFIALQLQII